MCGESLQEAHRHLYERGKRALLCVCRGCTILFDRREAGGGHYRLVPERTLVLSNFEFDDVLWARFDVPVELAFFRRPAEGGRIALAYPSVLGATEAHGDPAAWGELEAANPVLASLEPEVEALLVNRLGGAREHWIAPLDRCYALVGVIRTHWRGLAGGGAVWGEVARFLETLRLEAVEVDRTGARTRAAAGP